MNQQLLLVFRSFWKINSILDVIAVSIIDEKLNIFSYNPFGEFSLVNLSDSNGHFYYNKIDNSLSHEINFIISQDIPNIFVKTRTKNLKSSNEISFGGPDGKMCEVFCRKLNVNCRFVLLKPGNMEKLNLSIYDVAINPTPIIYESGEYNIMKAYTNPVYFDVLVVVVKASRPLSILQTMTFQSQFGDSREVLGIILISAILMLFISRLRTMNFFSFTNVFSDILGITFKLDLRRLCNLKLKELFVVLPTILMGFFIINTVVSILTTFYTTQTYYLPDINSINEIDKIKCKIAVSSEHSKRIILDYNKSNWSSRIVFLNQWEFNNQLFRLDMKTCFIDSFRRADILMRYQKSRRRIVHVVKPTLVPQLHAYMIHPKSPHKHQFNELILNVMSSGLYTKWSSDIYVELYEEKILKQFVNSSDGRRPASLQLLYIFWPLTTLIYGSIVSSIIFCLEVFISRFSR